ncbi:MAG: sodium-dependent transporter [Thalassobaculaceae bacterium]
MSVPQREQWATNSGFLLATIGSAVGIGNIWRFAYVAGENGGGAFLVIYLASVVLVGAPLVLAELTVGRRAQADAVTAFERVVPGTRWKSAGYLFVAGGVLILAYYAVIAGWVLKYFVGASLGSLWSEAGSGYGAFFEEFISHPAEPVIWQAVMLGTTMAVSLCGVRGGIEALNRALMPVLVLLLVGLAIFAVSQPGSEAGIRFLFEPDWSVLSQPRVYLAALGQAFFSLGVGMAIFITFGGYLAQGPALPISVGAIVAGDTLLAITAGLAIFPVVLAHGVDPASGPQLAFITLPQVFLGMPGGTWLGILFFGLLTGAALTSMVSILEVPTAAVMTRWGVRRRNAVAVVGGGCFVLGVPAALSYGVLSDTTILTLPILDAMDGLASNYVLPLGGLVVALFVGWRWGAGDAIAQSGLLLPALGRAWIWLLRIVAPAVILAILLGAVGGE